MKPLFSMWWLVILGEAVAVQFYGAIVLTHFAPHGFLLPSDLNCFWVNGALARNAPGVIASQVRASCAFMNPPPFLLIAAPLSWLPPLPAYIVWVIVTNAALTAAARLCGFSWLAIGLALVSPANLYGISVGQTGELTSALLLLSLGLSKDRPIAAGIFAAGLIIKPQFGLLLPVCFLAARNYRALAAAAVTVVALALGALAVFGPAAWEAFFGYGTAAARGVLDQNWPQPFQGIMVTLFIMLRSMGSSLNLAYLAQALATSAALAAAWVLWSRPAGTARYARLAVTMCLVILATPYAYLYDLPGVAMAVTGLTAATRWKNLFPLALLTVFTGYCILFSMLGFAVGAAFLFTLAVSLWPKSNAHSEALAPGRIRAEGMMDAK